MARVVVGLSGGVDSSVAAHLLQEEGHEVIGVFMRNWNDDSVIIDDECPWIDDSNDALLVAQKLGIPFQTLDFSEPYKERIVDYMFREYEAGRTPNPDVLCNREIKFDVFLKAAEKLGADYVATGHYCQKAKTETPKGKRYQLLAGADPNKDQSYFLCQISQEQLSKALFPIGHLQKSQVRTLAADLGLVTADKKDSQGLCFVGKVRLPEFLQQQLKPKQGQIIEVPANLEQYVSYNSGVDVDSEEVLTALAKPFQYNVEDGLVCGEHIGAHFFTIGQRKGLRVGGKEEPLFVLATDVTTNTIYAGQGESHPGLHHKALHVAHEEVHWLRDDCALQTGESKEYMVRIRYRQPLQKARVINLPSGLYVHFDEPQKAITPGQFVAWYDGNELIGSGVIS